MMSRNEGDNRSCRRAAPETAFKRQPLKAILFDKDGTLFDFRLTWMPIIGDFTREIADGDPELVDRLLLAAGYDRRRDRFAADGPIAAGSAVDIAAAWSSLLPRIESAELQRRLDGLSDRYAPGHSIAVCDLRALLQTLRAAGLHLGLATSDCESAARATLARFGVESQFAWISGYDSGNGAKPEAAVVQRFAAAVGVRTSEVAVVGDTLHDLRMARDAGAALAIGVLTGAGEYETLLPEADAVIESVALLPDLLGLPGSDAVPQERG